MTPFEVPMTIDAETAMQVGVPKFRLPISENACPFSFFSLVHLTTSHGGEGVSMSGSPASDSRMLLREAFLECTFRNAGDEGRGDEAL
jgi:hypothetical protein